MKPTNRIRNRLDEHDLLLVGGGGELGDGFSYLRVCVFDRRAVGLYLVPLFRGYRRQVPCVFESLASRHHRTGGIPPPPLPGGLRLASVIAVGPPPTGGLLGRYRGATLSAWVWGAGPLGFPPCFPMVALTGRATEPIGRELTADALPRRVELDGPRLRTRSR